MLLFDYLNFKQELREHKDPRKREVIERLDNISTAISLEKESFYAYLKKFKVKNIPYKVPEEVSADFDWELLFQLVAGSFSSQYQLIYPKLDDTDEVVSGNELPELCVLVKSGDQSVTKTISELWSFQLLRLYEIYLEEQINLHILKCEDENEENTIDMEREMRLKRFTQWKAAYLKYKNDLQQKNIRQKILNG